MNLEPFVYLFVLLLLTFLTFFARWLNEQVRKEINLQDLFGPSEPPVERKGGRSTQAPPPTKKETIASPARRAAPPNIRMRVKMAVHNKKDLRQAIVLMTVLGPCRALEPPAS